MIKFDNMVLKYDGKWVKPVSLPINTVSNRTNDGNPPDKDNGADRK